MLRVIDDRGVAKEAARMNVSALLFGQVRIVPSEGRFSAERLRDAYARGGEDLSSIRRATLRITERAVHEISRHRLPRVDQGRER